MLYLLQLVVDLIINLQRKRFVFAQTLQTLGDQMQVWKRVCIFGARSEHGCGKCLKLGHTPTKHSKEYPPDNFSDR